MNKEEKEAIEIQFERNLELLVRQKFPLTATAIVSSEQPMILLFKELIHRIEKREQEIELLSKNYTYVPQKYLNTNIKNMFLMWI